jgi:hypothetical protein
MVVLYVDDDPEDLEIFCEALKIAATNHSDLEFNQTTGNIKIKSGSYVQHFAVQSKSYLHFF